MLAKAPLALRHCLEAVNTGLDMPLEEGCYLEATLFGLCCASEDMKEGTRRLPPEAQARFQGIAERVRRALRETDSRVFDWNSPGPGEGTAGAVRRLVEADDETLRDGLQSPSAKNPPLQSKLEFLRILVRLGVQAVDIGLPAAGPHILEDTLFLAKEIASERLPIEANCAARTLSADIRPILEISQKAGIRIRVATFIGSSAVRQYAEGWDLAFLLKATRESVIGSGARGDARRSSSPRTRPGPSQPC